MIDTIAKLKPKSQIFGEHGLQAQAPPTRIFELRKDGDQYQVHPTADGTSFVPHADGEFIYVVRADDPGKVYIAIDARNGPPALRQHGVEGHTSFDKGGDILYAGEIVFDNGKLVSWDNASGHYRPEAESRFTNLSPIVQLLLPEKKILEASPGDVDGKPLWGALLNDGLENVKKDLINRIQFRDDLVTRLMRDDPERVTEILLTVSSERTSSKPIVLAESNSWGARINQQLDRLRGGLGRVKSNLMTYFVPGGGMVQHTGVGLQAYGVYINLRGIGAAIKRGDTADAVVAGGGLLAEGASLGLESGLPRLGNYLGKGNVESFNAFAKTSLGTRLGGQAKLGAGIGRAASVAGTVLTLPFDIYGAVGAFRQAGATSGKQQQDRYVDGGFAVASAVASVGLAGAATAGLATAGPIGVVVGVALAGANNLYHSIRYVEDIERHAPLTHGERFVTGLSNFFGAPASQPILDRVAVGQARDHYRATKRDQLQSYLQASTHGYAIFGDALISAQPPIKQTQTRLVWAPGGPYVHRDTTVKQQPAKVTDNAGEDDIDASAGVQNVGNLVQAPHRRAGSVLWATGEGKDRLKGVTTLSNVFEAHTGEKHFTGGNREDRFDLVQSLGPGSTLDGGAGSDTLALHFSAKVRHATQAGHDMSNASVRVVLPTISGKEASPLVHSEGAGRVITAPGSLEVGGQRTVLSNIENVVTSATARTAVIGNQGANVIVLNGDGDSAEGGGGGDTFVVNGNRAKITPGPGHNRYVIGRASGRVDIDNARAPSGKHHLQLDVDIGALSVVASGQSLEIRLDGAECERRIVLGQVFHQQAQGLSAARLADGDIVITTRDGYAITPTLSSISGNADGEIELVVMARS